MVVEAWYRPAFWLFVISAASDAVDGFIAKRFNATTLLGSYLDPIADKSMLAASFVALGVIEVLPVWIVILVVFRDLSIIGGWLLMTMLGWQPQVHPLFISKLNTTVQIALVGVAFAKLAEIASIPELVLEALMYLTCLTTVMSGTVYVGRLFQASRDLEGPQ